MENKLKAILLTILILALTAGAVYGFIKNAQFIGIILLVAWVLIISFGIYKLVLQHLNNKK